MVEQRGDDKVGVFSCLTGVDVRFKDKITQSSKSLTTAGFEECYFKHYMDTVSNADLFILQLFTFNKLLQGVFIAPPSSGKR